MEFKRHDIEYASKKDWINIIPIGDIHLGNSGCDIDKIRDMVEWIKSHEDNTYWIGMGDYIDAINYSDPRFDPKTINKKFFLEGDIDKIIQFQIEEVTDLFKPIRNSCLGLLRGNHEETIRKYYHYDVLYEMAKDLELPRSLLLYDTSIIRTVFKRAKSREKSCIDIFCAHGNIGGRTYGSKANRLHDLMKYFKADIYLLAHSHIKQSQSCNQIYFDKRGTERKRKVVMAMTGCFLQGYSRGKTSYCEKWLFPPTDTGVIKLQINPYTRDKHVSL